MPAPVKIEVGTIFHKLTVLGASPSSPYGKRKFRCLCECGIESDVSGYNLRKGLTKSCGCMARDPVVRGSVTHGMHSSPTYYSYQTMKARCLNEKNPNFAKYGAAGIGVCERWKESFENFLLDMGERPPGTSLDRIDNSRGYAPDNCRWATRLEQQNNRGDCIYIEVDGQRLTISQAARKVGVKESTLRYRVKRGWPVASAISPPASETQ